MISLFNIKTQIIVLFQNIDQIKKLLLIKLN